MHKRQIITNDKQLQADIDRLNLSLWYYDQEIERAHEHQDYHRAATMRDEKRRLLGIEDTKF